MTFDRSWVLFIAWVPLAWAAYELPRTRRRLGLALKALAFIAVLLALAEPSITLPESKLAVAVLVDTSASTSSADLERANEISKSLSSARGSNWMSVIPFARTTRPVNAAEQKNSLRLASTTGEAGRATDLEAAVREAIATLPAGKIPRVALISDGKENQGSVARAAWQARELGIPIDTFALAGRAKPAIHLDSTNIPALAFTGEQFPIDAVVTSPNPGPAEVELSAEGQVLGKTQVTLVAGQNPIRLHTSLNTPGALELSVAIRPAGSAEIRFNQTVTLRKPKVLYFSGDLAEDDTHILSVLTGAQMDVKTASNLVNIQLSDYQLVIFNNWDLESMTDSSKKDVEEYVRMGGGLLIIGGERNVYDESKANIEDALERTLPAKLAPPRSPEGTGVILIIDKSSSMEGRKMELARLAAIGAVNNLRPIDQVGVLAFDNTFEWAVPLRKAEDKAFINRIISGIRPDGGTQIAPALAEAFSKMRSTQAASRHIVLLTDGISEEGNSFTTANSAKNEKITISTVGIGQDVNKAYLEKVAQTAAGKSYFVLDLTQLEQILVKDVLEHTGTTTNETPLAPEVVKKVEILNDVAMDTAPLLKGYVRFIAKPSAETILKIDREDPLLSRWQYGLGRAAVFASDAKSRWATDWIKWKGFDKFWTNVARDLLPHTPDGEATLEYDSANGELVANYRLGRGVKEPATIPAIFAFGPGGFQQPMPVKKIATGTYQGRLKIGAREGMFRVLPAQESKAFPEAGLYRPEAELNEYGNNEALLKQVAEYTGGKFQPQPSAVFTGTGKTIPTTLTLWPAFLGLAVLLSLAELVLRKWKGVFQS
jgi:Ca-activated chloride channel homolog